MAEGREGVAKQRKTKDFRWYNEWWIDKFGGGRGRGRLIVEEMSLNCNDWPFVEDAHQEKERRLQDLERWAGEKRERT
jgi:hypothetical protein